MIIRTPRLLILLLGLLLITLVSIFSRSAEVGDAAAAAAQRWKSVFPVELVPRPPQNGGSRKVIGLVFYGRREYVSILDCYLKRNLRENGGILDEVIFAVYTKDELDLAYLEELLDSSTKYSKYVAAKRYKKLVGSWEAVRDPDAIYVKIDDDVVYIEDGTISSIISTLEKNPHYFAVSANVVNNPALSWVHYSLGAYEAFWPELTPPEKSPPLTWRTSALPSYEGPPDGPLGFAINGSTPAPYSPHRWLPVRIPPSSPPPDLALTPASTLTFDPFGPGLTNWAAVAQTHYSLLWHLENNSTHVYRFSKWDYAYTRLSINLFAIRGRDIMEVFPFPEADDEGYLTCTRPREVGRHVVVDGRGVAAHFAFGAQRGANGGRGVGWTDTLERYRGFAEEMVCPFPKREMGSLP